MKPAPVRHAGYTIVETMIFLVISSALLLSALGLFGNRIQNSQFTQSVQALATRIQLASNQVSTGTYPNSPAFTCAVNGGVPNVTPNTATPGADDQGTRTDCVFAGKVINFTVADAANNCTDPITNSSCEDVEVYTAVGRREANTINHTSVTSLAQANPRLVLNPDITQRFKLGYSTHVTSISLIKAGVKTPVSAVGLFQSFGGSYDPLTGNLTSGSQNVSTWAVKKAIGATTPLTAADVNGVLADPIGLVATDADNGLLICLQGGYNGQTASISLGAVSSNFTATVTIGDSKC